MRKYRVQNHVIGIIWFIASMIFGNINDVIMKYFSFVDISAYQIIFCRFLASAFVLLPFIFYYSFNNAVSGKKYEWMNEYDMFHRSTLHVIRAVILFFAMNGWIIGMSSTSVPTATSISFTIPIFVIMFAKLFLKEKIQPHTYILSLMAFLGTLIVLNPFSSLFDSKAFYIIFSCAAFAMLDIINKKYITKESTINMLFYSSAITAFMALPFAVSGWVSMSAMQISVTVLLGMGSNMILYCVLRAFALIDASSTAPLRYFELIISSVTSYIFFSEIPNLSLLIGGVIIITSTIGILIHKAI